MNQKNLVAILGVAVIILLGTTIYFATISNVSQPAPAPIAQQPVTPAPVAQTPTTNPPTTTQPAPTTPTLSVYSNEKYGIKISFPPEIASFEKIERNLDSTRAFNPVFDVSFGKDKNDFFEEYGKQGNMLRMWIFDRTKCNSPKLDSTEKDFCNFHKTDNSNGSWKGYDKDSKFMGFWIGNQKNLYYLYVSGTDKARNSNAKTFIGKLKIELTNN